MDKIKIEDVYFSHIRNGIIADWKLELMQKRENNQYECMFKHLQTGETLVKLLAKSDNEKLNCTLDNFFCV